MAELRKLIRLAENAYAITIPRKFREYLKIGFGDYLEIAIWDKTSLILKKHGKPAKP